MARNVDKRNTNRMKVCVKADRTCHHCGNLIAKGTICLTINTKTSKRVWYCEKCAGLIDEMKEMRYKLDSVSFGDEGAAMYYSERLQELESELGID